MMASPFCEKYWSWFKEKQAEGFEIISFALRRPPFTTLPLEQIEFAGKVNVGVVSGGSWEGGNPVGHHGRISLQGISGICGA